VSTGGIGSVTHRCWRRLDWWQSATISAVAACHCLVMSPGWSGWWGAGQHNPSPDDGHALWWQEAQWELEATSRSSLPCLATSHLQRLEHHTISNFTNQATGLSRLGVA